MTITVTDLNFNEFTQTGVALLDIKAEWCVPCKSLSPIIDELATEYTHVKIGKLDADENASIVKQLEIRSVPTLLLYKDGEIVEKHQGIIQKSQLKSLIDKFV